MVGPAVVVQAVETLGRSVRTVLLVSADLLARVDGVRGVDPLEEWVEAAIKEKLRREEHR